MKKGEITKIIIGVIAVGCMLATTAQAQTLVWSEEFNSGTVPDSNVWSYDIGNWGWGNLELQNYTANSENVRVEGGNLIITAIKSGSYISSARIKTLDKLTFKYGTIEARIQIPDLADGLWPAFWTLGNNFGSGAGWPQCGEMDIMEMGMEDAINDGVVNRRLGSHFHWWDDGGTDAYAGYGRTKDMPSDIDGTFVIYRMEWTPTAVSIYINDQWIITMNTASIPEFNQPHFFILNLAVGGNYPGIWNASGITAPTPAEYMVDYIRIYENGYTVLGGSYFLPHPPVFTVDPIIMSSTAADAAYTGQTVAGAATDPDSDPLSYSLVPGGPAWLSVATSGTLSGTPGGGDVGLNQWTLQVSDGNGGTDTATLYIPVDEANAAPIFTADPITKASATEDVAYTGQTVAGAATDADSDPLSYSLVPGGPAWLSVATSGTLSGTPGSGNVGLNQWTLQVSDGQGGTDTATLNVTVIAASPPTQPTLDVSIQAGGNVQISLPTEVGVSYQVLYKANMADATWTLLETIVGDGTTKSVSYGTSAPARCYKVLIP